MSTLLSRLDAVQQLHAGCHELQQPEELAEELVRFLALRRLADKAGIGISPGFRVHELWHWMLLNTKVARAVHEVVGGDIDHASTDERMLSDEQKLERRLLALNLLQLEGPAPSLEFWQEPGTRMDTILCTRAANVSVYIAASMTPAAASAFTHTFLSTHVPRAPRNAAIAAGLVASAAALVQHHIPPVQANQQPSSGGGPPVTSAHSRCGSNTPPARAPRPHARAAPRTVVRAPAVAAAARGCAPAPKRKAPCDDAAGLPPPQAAPIMEPCVMPAREPVYPDGFEQRKRGADGPGGMGIFIKDLAGNTRSLRVTQFMTVEDLLWDHYLTHGGRLPERVRLVFKGRPLEDAGRTLVEYGIQELSTVHVVAPLQARRLWK